MKHWFFSLHSQIRGATNAVKKLQESSSAGGNLRVVTHSSGNHAQALALAARNLGIPAEIVMPSSSPAVKVRAVEGYGGIITLCHPSEQVCCKLLLLFSQVKREPILFPLRAVKTRLLPSLLSMLPTQSWFHPPTTQMSWQVRELWPWSCLNR